MSYDPTQQVPPPQGYPPPQAYPSQPTYSPPPGYAPQPPAPATYAQYASQPVAPTAGAGFDFNAFWRSLGLIGQVAGIAGVALFIFFIFPWFSISVPSFSDSWNGFSSASGPSEGGQSISYFPYLWLVLLGALGLIALAVLMGQHRLSSRTGTISVIATSGVALALEICFLIEANSLTKGVNGGPAAGFWLGAIATLAALGAGVYALMQGRKPANPYQQPAALPYANPYQQTPQYPGSQPYTPPGQYPGQPPYPGQ
jgi:hypothetical protein